MLQFYDANFLLNVKKSLFLELFFVYNPILSKLYPKLFNTYKIMKPFLAFFSTTYVLVFIIVRFSFILYIFVTSYS